MNELLPYEQQLQQQWIDLPLPDENLAWADMKRRLEEDDDDGIIAWWRRGCVVWGVLLLTVISILWWIGQKQDWFTSASEKTSEQTTVPGTSGQTTPVAPDKQQQPGGQPAAPSSAITPDSFKRKNENENSIPAENEQQTNSAIVNTQSAGTGRTGRTSNQRINTSNERDTKVNRVSNSSTTITTSESAPRNRAGVTNPAQASVNTQPANRSRRRPNSGDAPGKVEKDVPVSLGGNEEGGIKKQPDPTVSKIDSVLPSADSTAIALKQKPDSSDRKVDTSISKAKTEQPPPAPKKDSTKKSTHFFSAGVGLHQLIPVDGQKATPYNSLGRKGSLADYIPSVYFRYNKTDKWFVQAEFRYGAPQYTNEFVYKQTKTPGQLFTDSSSFKLQKTYYHQLPVTFDYYIVKNWSLGTGIIWNRFSSAVSEVENYRRNNSTFIDSLQSTEISKDKDDSLFAKSYLQATFQTHFQWKRLSIGARYSFGLQPYIKFSLPNGVQREERNSSLQVFLRYDLWRSKKK